MTYKKQLEKRVLAGLLAGAALWLGMPAALAASGAVPNTQLPQGGSVMAGNASIGDPNNGQLTITQGSQNAVIQWGGGFNVGANATVNFEKGKDYSGTGNFNTLNYDASGNMSQIYGAINAQEGNIYIVNPAGVEISSSAQINVGSLYVSNKKMADDVLRSIDDTSNITNLIQSQAANTNADAVLMSLGNVNADHVTFDGGRIVIDTERLKTDDAKMDAKYIHVRTTDAGQVVLGYDAYNEGENKGTYKDKQKSAKELATVTAAKGDLDSLNGYMWVEDIEQLQAVSTNSSGQYALRNSIDATATKDWTDGGFKPIIGTDDIGKEIAFTGKFDGLDYNIFNLNINRNTGNVGLFGMVGNGAVIQNVTLVGGSIKGWNNVGALAGQVSDGAQISNIMNSASVTGSSTNVGGIIGSAGKSDFKNLVNTGTVAGTAEGAENNAGGLIGSLTGGTLSGTSYNLGGVTGKGYNVGGLVGKASDAALGGEDDFIYNRLNVSGAYNVGGIVGSMTNTTVKNAENSGNVTATGFTTGNYKYHTAHDFGYGQTDNGVRTETVNIANAGGIAGKSDSTGEKKSEIKNVQNSGDVSSGTDTENGYTYYTAGNVGGIVGNAVDTNISNATNEENDIRGAHNVGGIAGYFSGEGTITTGINSGGDILATGARKDSGFVKEWVRAGNTGQEEAIIGNMGGVAGYMDGDNVYIASSANRGTVHSQDIIGNTVLPVSQAANVGGIVGKIDRSDTLSKNGLGTDYEKAAVSNSYNTGDVRGYTAVGGVAGMMYNGEIAGSYNLGTINTTRKYGSDSTAYYTVNMGGIVGDTTENAKASALLYDVYNKGQIGDSAFNYASRHVGGIVGRLSGVVEKAYNTGAIYNGYNVVGGIAGWMAKGSITNSFNTGNITVKNQEKTTAGIQAGGIVGGASIGVTISNVYNLGTIRGFQSSFANGYAVGGIVGAFIGDGSATVSNAYTTGNLYLNTWGSPSISGLGSIYGTNGNYNNQNITTVNTYYIKPADGLPFEDLSGTNQGVTSIGFDEKDTYNYTFEGGITKPAGSSKGENVDEDAAWRIYAGSTPILNAFLPNTEKYFSGETGVTNAMDGISSIQYGTAYDPLLTIINAAEKTENLTFDWQELGASNAAGIAVYGANLTLNDFMATGGSGYFGGLIYSDGALSIASESGGDIALGSASQLYGSSVSISADGNVTIYGDVTATGNKQDGTTRTEGTYSEKEYLGIDGSISITGGSVDVYGQLTSAKEGEKTKVPGINGMAESWTPGYVGDPTKPMTDIGDRFGYTTGASAATGSISITAEKNGTASEDGHVNVYYGHQQKGFLDTAGNLTVSGAGDVYMDSDLSVGGNLSISAGADSEAVLDISNIGQVQAANNASQAAGASSAVSYLHKFLEHFSVDNGSVITLNGGKQKIAVDMWTDNAFDLDKFDHNGKSLSSLLNGLNINGSTNQGQEYTYIWVSTGEELKNIQAYYKANEGKTHILSYNFALKNDIDASAVKDYVAIGTDSDNGFTGTFDGRDHRIIGLNVQGGGNAGIFDTVGTVENEDGTKTVGKVEDLRVYSGTFNGTDNAGAVAGINNGTISNVTTFGNVVTATNKAAGGIAGDNFGAISNASASDAVTDKKSSNAGGIAGINEEKAVISDSSSNSAVSSKDNALGGIAGVNSGTLSNVDSLGVTTGIYKGTSTRYSDNVGGIAGRNSGTVSNAYNESIVSGRDNVGGIIGTNTGKNVENVSNAARVTGEADTSDTSLDKTSDYVGGLVGSNSGSITNGRNNGKITGNQYVGGLVGENGKDSTLSNLVNDEAASIIGDNYVGGIAGSNAGEITADEKNDNLVNRGSITGQMYVGGVAGVNTGTIKNTISSIALHVKTPYTPGQGESTAPKYFGGVVGQNSGIIDGTTNESSVDVAADGATMVGGIIGENTSNGTLKGTIANTGLVSGKSEVGGIIGSNKNQNILNNADKDENGQPNKRLVVSNSGQVQAEDGGAAGIFYENTGAIHNADLINTGTVIGGTDSTSVTGGLFGTNSGTITNSTLTNTGTVYGGGTVGGLIGENTGDISTSSLINSVNGKVIGLNNVGGLIGQNYGTITGGRTEKNEKGEDIDVGYYKYQIYNNGTITVGKWTDSDQDGKIADGEITTDVSGSNIGGLFGTNSAEVTAAYNTGAIMAGGSTNVGGIAGSNTGKLDQVFNTVMTADGKNQTISGGTNVGGIVGSNEAGGIVSNAYNTSDIIGTDTVGGIAGTNSGTISNVYGTGSGNLVNTGTGTVSNVYDSDAKNFGTNGSVIDTTGESSASTVLWRQYGDKNPLLKVFLTKVTYNPENDQNLVYNGKEQTLNVTGNGFSAADGFAAHENVSGGLIYHDVAGEHKNAGTYTDNLWSEQIKAGSTDDTFNPNNLGYDVQSVEYKINKAQITINLDTVDRVYGNTTPIEGNGYGFSYGFSNVYEDAKDTLSEELKGNLTLGDVAVADDTALRDEDHTKDANGVYTWTGTVTLNNSLSNNYEFVNPDGTVQSGTSITTTGDSNVEKATITVDLIDVNRTYGNAAINKTDTNKNGDYGVANISGVTNGDSYTVDNFTVTVEDGKDGALDTKPDDNRVTNDAGEYTYTGSVTGADEDGRLDNNYNIVVKGSKDNNNTGTGKSTVSKATITIGLNDVERTYGDATITNGGSYGINSDSIQGVTNGDSYDFTLDQDSIKDDALTGAESGKATADAGNYTYTGKVSATNDTDGKLNQNYTIKVTDGNSAVNRRKLTVDNIIASIIYGDQGGNGFTITGGNLDGILYQDDVKLDNNLAVSDSNIVEGSAYDQNKGDRTTADVDTYENSLSYSGLKLTGDDAKNYYIDGSASGTITVNKAQLTVGLGEVHRTYGDADITKGGYTASITGGLVNGDENLGYGSDDLKVTVNGDGALTGENTGRVTNDAGEYEWSGTVSGKDGTLTNLSNNYEITVSTGKSYVDKAKLTVGLGDVHRTYGSTAITTTGGYTVSSIGGLVNGDKELGYGSDDLEVTGTVDGALTGENTGRVTNDAGEYAWSGTVSGKDGTLTNLSNNYEITVDGHGTSIVDKANLNITINDVNTTYGTAFNTGDYGYTFGQGEVVNGDDEDSLKNAINAAAGGYINTGAGTDGHATQDAGDGYSLSFADTVDKDILNNYTVSVTNGTSTVSKAEITVSADSHQIYIGAPEPTYTGTTIEDLLVNGDSLNGTSYEYGPEGPVDTNQTGNTDIGIHFGDTYFGSGTDWSSAWDGFKNYNITFTPGTLTVEGMPPDMPEISDSEKWNSLLRDTPWDRNGNFRERKAEIHFIAGGMSY